MELEILESDEFEIECLGEQEVTVYDIEVEDNHNFFANDILVHNSCYLNFGGLVEKILPGEMDDRKISRVILQFCRDKVEPFIEKCYEELGQILNAYENKISMKLETISSTAIWVAKKNYALYMYSNEGIEYDPPKVKVTGIKAVKSSTPAVCRNSIKDAIKIMLTKTEPELHKHIESFKTEFMKMDFEQIAFPRGVSEVDLYANSDGTTKNKTPINTKAAITYNNLIKKFGVESKYGLIGNGDKIKFAYLKEQNPYGSNVIASLKGNLPKEFNAEKYLDYNLQFEKTYIQPITGLLNSINWTAEEKSTLDEFLS